MSDTVGAAGEVAVTRLAHPAKMIDISADQHPTGQPLAAKTIRVAGYEYAMVKASDGTNATVNPWTARDGKALEAAGVKVGYYHFAHPGQNGPHAEVQAVMRAIRGLPRTIGVMLDLEVTEGQTWAHLAWWAETFLGSLPSSVVNRSLYSNLYYLDNLNPPDHSHPWGHHLVLAEWGVAAPTIPCWAWQSGLGEVPGIVGPCDVDVFYG